MGLKCIFVKHKFLKIGIGVSSSTLEKHVVCKKCAMYVMFYYPKEKKWRSNPKGLRFELLSKMIRL